MDQVFLPKKEDILYQTVLREKTDRGEMEVEGERAKKTRKCHKTSVIKTRPKTRWYKTYVEKEMMAIEKIENPEAASESSPKKGNAGIKTKAKGTPNSPRKKIKKNTVVSELNFNQVKILNQRTKLTLMTDFLKSM